MRAGSKTAPVSTTTDFTDLESTTDTVGAGRPERRSVVLSISRVGLTPTPCRCRLPTNLEGEHQRTEPDQAGKRPGIPLRYHACLDELWRTSGFVRVWQGLQAFFLVGQRHATPLRSFVKVRIRGGQEHGGIQRLAPAQKDPDCQSGTAWLDAE